jgi:hypothetical protein
MGEAQPLVRTEAQQQSRAPGVLSRRPVQQDVSHYVKNPADIDVNFFGQLKEIIMPREKSYDDMTENERDQYERDNLEDEYYKTQAEMDGEEDDSNDKD